MLCGQCFAIKRAPIVTACVGRIVFLPFPNVCLCVCVCNVDLVNSSGVVKVMWMWLDLFPSRSIEPWRKEWKSSRENVVEDCPCRHVCVPVSYGMHSMRHFLFTSKPGFPTIVSHHPAARLAHFLSLIDADGSLCTNLNSSRRDTFLVLPILVVSEKPSCQPLPSDLCQWWRIPDVLSSLSCPNLALSLKISIPILISTPIFFPFSLWWSRPASGLGTSEKNLAQTWSITWSKEEKNMDRDRTIEKDRGAPDRETHSSTWDNVIHRHLHLKSWASWASSQQQ